ncbi:concanavalin A-like lectin/glucanase superfamily protein [Roseimicrobium gellanilyticum]|uniref:Concanavalin A-like lectin/glucanase superfamily protein n=1 Tax=Roseimicrobium gellanilyticum TaxID=748857 RepID=A0A366H907_9BACT|nr:DUF1553 domain-containing protein [Roseimicrobium gellanilyticum]RBP38088.1 concanavalin A-like lectin/glucanase superfamily protein [Roseimicrobium gellanilyticum]
MELAGKDAALLVPDAPGLRFKKGDAITLEAWVKVRSIREGQMIYLVGKGRNGSKEFGDNNQNYALRLKGVNGRGAIGFLFTAGATDGQPLSWHRWWSTDGFQIDTGWHHVALTYVFGQRDSLRGYIDGALVKGTWDLGGATDRGPVSDGDLTVIGTGYSRGPAETLDGWLDEVAIHRTALSAATLKTHFAVAPAPAPEIDRSKLPAERVRVELCEKGVPENAMWPVETPTATESYLEEVFGFSELPQRYVATGVRGDRSVAFLLRASALVRLPKGTNRLLLRGRGASRLFIDGQPVLQTPFPTRGKGGFALLTEQSQYLDLGPDFRFAPPGNREATGTFVGDGEEHLVVLETVVGGGTQARRYRPELGETVVAISPEGSTAWSLLSPGNRQVPYTDAGWTTYAAERSAHFAQVNAEARAACRQEGSAYWSTRRKAAAQWLASTPEVPIPELPSGFPANNAIDHFLAARIADIAQDHSATPKDGVDFYRDVQPILEAKCYGCHQGGKVKSGLRLDTREAALQGGESDGAAIVPGKPAESSLFLRTTADPDEIMPPKGKGEPLNRAELSTLERWIAEGAHWPDLRVSTLKMTPLTDDLTFLRRVTLDTVGVVPGEEEIRAFLADSSTDRRAKVIERLLADPRWADRWMGYWQDVLAENPNILNPTLNNTGPFRWWIYESLRDDKPMDLFVTELIRMQGSVLFGGPAGFGIAAQNDVPMAQKAMIVSSAFLGVEMKCARCHDSPANLSRQQDLFEMAAMLAKKPIKLPATSSVPLDRIHQGGRKPLIEITLAPGSIVEPKWPLGQFSSEATVATLTPPSGDSRERLATLITAPQNTRFAQVIVNRFWQQLMGRGLVEPVEDWEKGQPSHPELLAWLGREFVRSGYSARAIQRLILNSHAYQRQVDAALPAQEPLFVSPAPRRLAAEQIVDALFAASGKPFALEEMSLDLDGDRSSAESIVLGQPRRAWMLASTSNERDRPSLMLPRIQAVADVMEAFGWRGTRVDPVSRRETSPNVLQPAILSNGIVGGWLTRLSDDHALVQVVLEDQPVEALVDRLFLRLLTRAPSAAERELYVSLLSQGYNERAIPVEKLPALKAAPRERPRYISWSNHVDPAANVLREEQAERARHGDTPTARLDADWRERFEDVLWALINAPTWVTAP